MSEGMEDDGFVTVFPSGDVSMVRAQLTNGSLRVYNESGYTPTEYKVIIKPDAPKEKIGSIFIPDNAKDAEKFNTVEGIVIAVSPLAFNYASADEWTKAKATPPKPGDRVLYSKYAGVWIKDRATKTTEYLIVNDKDIVCTIPE